MKERYAVVISSATDFNRGDQALLWETQNVIYDALGIRKVYILNNENETLDQSQNRGMIPVSPVLYHPSHVVKLDKKGDNINYSLSLKAKWGCAAAFDYINSVVLLHDATRQIGISRLNDSQKITYNLIKDADAIFVKGGGFIHAYGKFTDIYYIYYSLFHIRLAQELKRKVYILPNSFGPFEGLMIKHTVKKTLSKCIMLTSRESVSQKALEQIGVENSVLLPDMAFILNSDASIQAIETIQKFKLEKSIDHVAITVRPYRFPESNNPQTTYLSYKKEMAMFIDWLTDNGYHPIFVEHTYSLNDHENDRKCIDEIESMVKQRIDILSNRNLNCEELKFIYSKFNYVVGTRFHSVIFSMSEGIPGIAISYSGNKAIGIMRDSGLDEYVLSANDITHTQLIETFQKMKAHEDAYRLKMCNYKKLAIDSYETLLQMIQMADEE